MCSLQNGVLTMVSMAVGSQTTHSLCLKVGVSCSCYNAMASLGTGELVYVTDALGLKREAIA